MRIFAHGWIIVILLLNACHLVRVGGAPLALSQFVALRYAAQSVGFLPRQLVNETELARADRLGLLNVVRRLCAIALSVSLRHFVFVVV